MRTRPRYLWVVAAVIVATLIPLQQASAAGNTSAAGNQVTRYDGLTRAQQADLRSVASDTWKFYSPDVDPVTNLPMDNLTFAGGSATPRHTAGTPRPRTSGCICGPWSRPGTWA